MSTASEKTYNGWTNYETWCFHLWLTNESASQAYWQDVADDIRRSNGWPENNDGSFGRLLETDDVYRDVACDFTERLKSDAEETNPLADDASLWSDLLSAALSEVNWYEIAQSFFVD